MGIPTGEHRITDPAIHLKDGGFCERFERSSLRFILLLLACVSLDRQYNSLFYQLTRAWFQEPANLNPEELPKEVRDLPKGVYFGWVQVRGEGLDCGVHKMVMNIGNRPTFADSDAITLVSVFSGSEIKSRVDDVDLEACLILSCCVLCRKCTLYIIMKLISMARMPPL
jgi:hypothetical protein